MSAVLPEPLSRRPAAPSVARPWKLTPFLRATLAVHLGALVLLAFVPRLWPWCLAAVVFDHLLICAFVFMPRSRVFGPNLTRLPVASIARNEVALTFDDGPDPEVTPQVLDLLDAAGARATFFCVAARAQAHPALMQEIVRRGHEVQNHSFSHAHSFPARGLGAMRREIGRAQLALRLLTGTAPTLFRAPMGFRSPMLEPAVAAHGLRYVSWTRRGFDTRDDDATRVLARLTRGLVAGDILLLHDRGSATGAGGRPIVLDVLEPLLRQLKTAGLRSVGIAQALNA